MTQGKNSKSALRVMAFPARTVALGVESCRKSDWASHAFNSYRCYPLLVSGSAVAEPAVPTQLAETGAYLLGNAYRCGVADERVEHAGTAIRDLIVLAARDSAEAAAAESRFVEIFSALVSQAKTGTGSHPAKS